MADDEEWLRLLEREDVETFNGRRTERSRPELFAADLSGKKLVGVDLSNANLEKTDFTGTDLTDANLMKANLGGIDGSGMILRDALGLRARFKDAWMDEADITGADLAQADFADANLERSTGPGVRLAQARLRGVNAAGASWPGADLSEAKLQQAILKGADLRNADFTEASAAEADLSGARLDGVGGNGAKFPGAKFVEATLAAARLQGANFAGADLTGADLSAADLTRANLTGANLTGASLRGAVLADANLDGAVLTGADLADADLSGLDPQALGLGADVVGTLSGFGIAYDADAELVYGDVSVARVGDAVAVVWENPEGDPPPPPPPADEGEEPEEPVEPRTLRYTVFRKGEARTGVVPVPGESVLDAQVVAAGDAFKVVVTRSRPEGAALAVFPLGADGTLGAGRSVPLGYDPAVRPVIRTDGDRIRLLGLSRRGPMLVVHDLSEAEARPVRSDAASTGRGFLGGQPVLACKGGVVMPVSGSGAGKPRRTPETFPGTKALALPLGDDVLAVWALDRVGRTPGGVRFSVIGPRHAPREEVLSTRSGIVALAALAHGGTATAFWVEAADGATRLLRATLPGGEPEPLDGPDDAVDLRAAPGVLAVVRLGGGLALFDPESGRSLAATGP